MKISLQLILLIIIVLLSNLSFPHAGFKASYINELNNDYYIVSGDNLNVRSQPLINSKILYQLKITALVKVIKINKEEALVNKKKGRWVYVNIGVWGSGDDYNKLIHGWVFDYYLISLNKFQKVSSFYNCTIKWQIGDVNIEIKTFKNGTFKLVKNNSYNKSIRSGSGYIYKYDTVIYLKYDKSELEDLLYINKNRELCHIIHYESKKRACFKYK